MPLQIALDEYEKQQRSLCDLGDEQGGLVVRVKKGPWTSLSSMFQKDGAFLSPPTPQFALWESGTDGSTSPRICLYHPETNRILSGNRAPKKPETIAKKLAEGWTFHANGSTNAEVCLKRKAAQAREKILPRATRRNNTFTLTPSSPYISCPKCNSWLHLEVQGSSKNNNNSLAHKCNATSCSASVASSALSEDNDLHSIDLHLSQEDTEKRTCAEAERPRSEHEFIAALFREKAVNDRRSDLMALSASCDRAFPDESILNMAVNNISLSWGQMALMESFFTQNNGGVFFGGASTSSKKPSTSAPIPSSMREAFGKPECSLDMQEYAAQDDVFSRSLEQLHEGVKRRRRMVATRPETRKLETFSSCLSDADSSCSPFEGEESSHQDEAVKTMLEHF